MVLRLFHMKTRAIPVNRQGAWWYIRNDSIEDSQPALSMHTLYVSCPKMPVKVQRLHTEFKEKAQKYVHIKFKRPKEITGKWMESIYHINNSSQEAGGIGYIKIKQ